MAGHYLVGVAGAVASLFGFVFFYYKSLVRFRGLSKLERTASMEFPNRNRVNRTANCEAIDIIIVGAGVAGAALAYSLGKDGRRVRVIERDLNEPCRIAGENLMPGGYHKLIELGLEDCVDEIDAQRILGNVLYMDGKEATISFRSKVADESRVSSQIEVPSYCVGFVLTNCKLPHENYGGLVIAHPSPFVFYPISSTKIRCLVDVPSQNLPSVSDSEMARYLKTQVAPKVLTELYPAFISAIETGDSLNMRHSITGGGMTVVLSDVVLLRDLLRPLHDLSDASATCEYLESFYTLRKACFEYLRLGGVFAYGLSALHAGLHPRPLSLAIHFLAISIHGVGRLLLPFPSPKRLWNGARLLRAGSSIVLPFIQSEGVRQMFFPQTVPAYHRTYPRNERKV
ncbi:hypothetical protein V6N12_036525 [Hibiscus sabdariffa]|uniref:Squalene monooxygenase n=1 Tax=Hibiscus sabdariffa TaxID=183260 RepID=A0ABR2EQY6_9ROSI